MSRSTLLRISFQKFHKSVWSGVAAFGPPSLWTLLNQPISPACLNKGSWSYVCVLHVAIYVFGFTQFSLGSTGISHICQWLVDISCFVGDMVSQFLTQMLHGAGILSYIWVIFGLDVGKYSIHGASGLLNKQVFVSYFPVVRHCNGTSPEV